MTVKSQFKENHIWGIWILAVMSAWWIYSLTMTTSPIIWQDEVQIVDEGRSWIPGADNSWSVSWLPSGRPQIMICYLGSVLQEVGYRIANGDPVGPRTTALLGAILASAAMLGWLRARRLDPWVALACSLIFFFDPVFAQGYRGARVDAWTIGFMILALWVIRTMLINKHWLETPFWKPGAGHVLAAVCVAISGLFWVTAIMLVPLLIHEIMCDRNCSDRPPVSGGWLCGVRDLVWVGVFSLGFIALFLLPIRHEIYRAVADLAEKTSERIVPHDAHSNFKALFIETFQYNPWTLICGCIGFFILRRWPLGLAFLLAVAGVLATSFYIHRAVYLLPYLYLSIGLVANSFERLDPAIVKRWICAIVLIFLLVWSSGITLGARSLIAIQQRRERDPQQMLDLASRAIGTGPYRVYIKSWDGYYAGRKLGWKLFRFYDESPPGENDWNDLFRTMDFAMYSMGDISNKEHAALRALGFTCARFDCELRNSDQALPIGTSQSAYGPYWIYRRR